MGIRVARQLEPLVLLLLPALHAAIVFQSEFRIDPDSYYHFGCARLYAQRFWLSHFPWLEYTVLGAHFPNVHLLQHGVLTLFSWLPPLVGLKLSIIVLSSGLFFSLYAVLKRHRVSHAAFWVVAGACGSTLLVTISTTLKGAATFLILLVWIIDALLKKTSRRAFLLSWISTYAYVGAPVLLPLVFVVTLVRRLWGDVWDWRPLAAIAGGLFCGLLLSPFWPDHLFQVGAELTNAFLRPAALVPGVFRGGEWISITGADVIRFAGLFLVAWLVVLLRPLSGRPRVSAEIAAGVVIAMGLLATALFTAKFFHLFFVVSVLFLPLLAQAVGPWPRYAAPLALLAAVAAAGWNIRASLVDMKLEETRSPGPEDYQALGESLAARTQEDQMIVAPWDDFPGLFFYNTQNHYVSGMNNDFLRRANAKRFDAYRFLYEGKVSDPEKLLPMFFGDAHHIVVRSIPRNEGEKALLDRLQANTHFVQLTSPTPMFRVWELIQSTGRNPSQ